MPTVRKLQPKTLPQKASNSTASSETPCAVYDFQAKQMDQEVDMMPGDWAEAGNPTPYELRVTIHTCKRLWKLNRDALNHPDCDREVTEQNIKVLEKLYLILMDYLVE